MIEPLSPLWKERGADLLEHDAIKRHCYGLWPVTRLLMLKLAASQLVHLVILRDAPPLAMYADDVCVVIDRDDEGPFLARCLHEIAESVICRGDYPELLRFQDARIPHQVACLVEQRFLRAYRFHEAQRESEHEDHQAREGKRWQMPPEVYVLDEYADAPFELRVVPARLRNASRRRNLRQRTLK